MAITIIEVLEAALNYPHSVEQHTFHFPSQAEREIMGKYGVEGLHCEIGYVKQGNFTICIVVLPDSKQLTAGVAKRNCQLDKVDNVERACNISLNRALKNADWSLAR